MAKLEIMREFWQFIREEKAWWITPIVVVFLLLFGVVLLTDFTPVVLPFVYTIFG